MAAEHDPQRHQRLNEAALPQPEPGETGEPWEPPEVDPGGDSEDEFLEGIPRDEYEREEAADQISARASELLNGDPGGSMTTPDTPEGRIASYMDSARFGGLTSCMGCLAPLLAAAFALIVLIILAVNNQASSSAPSAQDRGHSGRTGLGRPPPARRRSLAARRLLVCKKPLVCKRRGTISPAVRAASAPCAPCAAPS